MKFQIFLKPRRRLSFDTESPKEAVELINAVNGVKDVYRSVYNYKSDVIPENARIDKIFLDFDPEDGVDILAEVQRVVGVLYDMGLSYSVYFSGRGFHVYVYTKPVIAGELNSAFDAIRNFVYFLMEKASEDGEPINYDRSVVGDIMRVSRLPNTMNLKTKMYCIPIKHSEVYESSLSDISQMAKTQRKIKNKVEGKLVDLKEYDEAVKKHSLRGIIEDFDDEDVEFDVNIENLPLCVKTLLERGDPGYNERYLIIVAMRDLAYPLSATVSTMKKYLNKTEFEHSLLTERQPQYLYSRPDLIFPSCYTIKQRGSCVTGCKGQNIYY
jgi:hypothetical protein